MGLGGRLTRLGSASRFVYGRARKLFESWASSPRHKWPAANQPRYAERKGVAQEFNFSRQTIRRHCRASKRFRAGETIAENTAARPASRAALSRHPEPQQTRERQSAGVSTKSCIHHSRSECMLGGSLHWLAQRGWQSASVRATRAVACRLVQAVQCWVEAMGGPAGTLHLAAPSPPSPDTQAAPQHR